MDENKLVKINDEDIRSLIYTIRGKQVMLSGDIARLYQVETKKLNQAVKRNEKRFPKEFCFQLTDEEYNSLRSQFVTLKNQGRGQHIKYLSYEFTEQGVAILKKTSIQIPIKYNKCTL